MCNHNTSILLLLSNGHPIGRSIELSISFHFQQNSSSTMNLNAQCDQSQRSKNRTRQMFHFFISQCLMFLQSSHSMSIQCGVRDARRKATTATQHLVIFIKQNTGNQTTKKILILHETIIIFQIQSNRATGYVQRRPNNNSE